MKARARKYLIVGGTFSVALGIGFVMQNGDALAARFGAEARPEPVVGADVARAPRSGVQVTEVAASAVAVPRDEVQADAAADGPVLPEAPETPTLAALQLPAPLGGGIGELRLPVLLTDFAADTLDALSEFSLAAATGLPRASGAPAPDAVAGAPETEPPAPVVPASVEAEDEVCGIDLRAAAAPAAMVTLSVSAPCHPQAEITVHHQGMIFSAMTGADGTATIGVPALSVNAIFIAEIEGDGAAASIDVPDLASYERAVLQWQGAAGLGLHALEDGAGYGQPGHVSAETARGPDAALAGGGGFVTALGGDAGPEAYQAEIYTYPAAMIADHDVVLNVEAVVLPDNCGRPIAAQTIQIAPDAPPTALDLTMTLPGCEAVGEYLVLSNMLRDLTLAMR